MDKRLVNRLRKALHLQDSDIPDNEILKMTEGSTTRAWVELGIAADNVCKIVSKYACILLPKLPKTPQDRRSFSGIFSKK